MTKREFNPAPFVARFAKRLRAFLDRLYLIFGFLAALFLLAILFLITAQVVSRWTGNVLPGASDYTGYAMAASSFFAFAHALNKGAHIRVSLFLNSASERVRYILNLWCFFIAALLAWNFSIFALKAVYWSWKLGDVSQGQDATPLWIPQSFMAAGAIVFAIALSDHLLTLLITKENRIKPETVKHIE